MPRVRSDIAAIKPYQVGRQLADVARAHGLDPGEIVKLTANEGPEGPFPGVVDAVTTVLAESNRYPDNACWDLGHSLAEELGVGFENLLFGAGSVALLVELAVAMGGPGTNTVYGWPSFIMYRFASIWAGAERREIPLDESFRLDFPAMRDAMDDATTMVVVCNPNNPTGTIHDGVPEGDRPPFQQMTFTLHDTQIDKVKQALDLAFAEGAFIGSPNANSNGNALARVCEMVITYHERERHYSATD
jgi:histidinol-phosphate/aromatic aminotransferase/cobyric acid decarboxylase-like protein